MQTGIAASETGNAYERATSQEMGTTEYASWRENLIWGEVHDGNAHFLGGAAGHAGLFSTVTETARIAAQFLSGQSEILSAQTVNSLEQYDRRAGRALTCLARRQLGSQPLVGCRRFLHSGAGSCWIDAPRAVFVYNHHALLLSCFIMCRIHAQRRRKSSLWDSSWLQQSRRKNHPPPQINAS